MTQNELFPGDTPVSGKNPRRIDLDGFGTLDYFPTWLSAEEAQHYFNSFYTELPWEQPEIFVYGQRRLIPRKQVWCGDSDAVMTYSGKRFTPVAWHPRLSQLRERLLRDTGTAYNSVLVNLYRDGGDSVSWHADDEPELGDNPIIASISLGAARRFSLKPKSPKLANAHIPTRHIALFHGDLIIMSGATQRFWHHAILKDKKTSQARINLTFRYVYPAQR